MNVRSLVVGAGMLGFMGASSPGLAFGLPSLDRVTPEQVQSSQFTADYDFEGIVALSNCSGSLVRYEDSLGTDRAMVLTNGHCVRMISYGTVLFDQASSRSFRLLTPEGNNGPTVRADRLLYATMTGTDMGLYRLTKTFDQIESQYGIRALTLANEAPEVDDAIEVISGYWRRGYSCSIEFTVHQLKEGDWYFKHSLRYSRPGCEVIGGTSGSPVIRQGTRTVVAVNNTGNESGRRCEVNNPCEIDEEGKVSYEKGYSYAQQIYWLYSCRDQDRDLDLKAPGCQLPKP